MPVASMMLEQTLKVVQALHDVEEKAQRVAVEHEGAAIDAENAHRDQILAQI